MLNLKISSCTLVGLLFAICFSVEAQQKMYKIGELTARPGLARSSDEFVRALRDLGYVEGKNIGFELRSAEGKPERFPALADELVRLKVDVLVATSTAEALAFRNATETIPIVFYTGGVLLRWGSLTAWHGLGGTSQVSLSFLRS